jgi:hypothetical protein
MFERRLNLRPNEPDCTRILKKQRNDLRRQLIKHREAKNATSFEPLMVRSDVFFSEYSFINFLCHLLHLRLGFTVFSDMFCNIQMMTIVWLLILNFSQSKSIGVLDLQATDPISRCTVCQDENRTIRYQQPNSTSMVAVFDVGLKISLPLNPVTLRGTHVGE